MNDFLENNGFMTEVNMTNDWIDYRKEMDYKSIIFTMIKKNS
jgi:hypothetical protein